MYVFVYNQFGIDSLNPLSLPFSGHSPISKLVRYLHYFVPRRKSKGDFGGSLISEKISDNTLV